jgi:hypothetical protein
MEWRRSITIDYGFTTASLGLAYYSIAAAVLSAADDDVCRGILTAVVTSSAISTFPMVGGRDAEYEVDSSRVVDESQRSGSSSRIGDAGLEAVAVQEPQKNEEICIGFPENEEVSIESPENEEEHRGNGLQHNARPRSTEHSLNMTREQSRSSITL